MATRVAGALCAQHQQQAVEVCSRCGGFVCSECVQLRNSAAYCSVCFARFSAEKPSQNAMVALVCGVLAWVCCPLLGVVGLVVANRELAEIDAGTAPEAGRFYANAARILGWVNVGVSALALVGLAIITMVAALAVR